MPYTSKIADLLTRINRMGILHKGDGGMRAQSSGEAVRAFVPDGFGVFV